MPIWLSVEFRQACSPFTYTTEHKIMPYPMFEYFLIQRYVSSSLQYMLCEIKQSNKLIQVSLRARHHQINQL